MGGHIEGTCSRCEK